MPSAAEGSYQVMTEVAVELTIGEVTGNLDDSCFG